MLAWCDDWAFVFSQHWVFPWVCGFVLLCETLAWGQWVLTQTLPHCPDSLLISALAVSIHSCLCLVFCGMWLCFSLLDLALSSTLAVLWRSHSCLCALPVVPFICICFYFLWFVLPGADVMEDSSFSGSSSGDYAHTCELSALLAATWEAFFGLIFQEHGKAQVPCPSILPPCGYGWQLAPDLFNFGCPGDYNSDNGEDPCDSESAAAQAEAATCTQSLLFLCGVSVQKFYDQNSTLIMSSWTTAGPNGKITVNASHYCRMPLGVIVGA